MLSIALLSLCAAALSVSNGPTEVSRINLKNVAFANLIDKSLYLSTFDANPFGGKDAAFVIKEASDLLKSSTVKPTQLTGSITWPNTYKKASASVFGVDGVLIGGGFLVPGKGDGGVWFSDGKSLTQLFKAKGYFYHQAELYDVNGDGLLDILTCRATKPMFGDGKGDLTYLTPVDRKKPLGPWKETVIGKGCDTFFVLEDINGDGVIDIASAEFWGSAMTLIQGPKGVFSDASKLTYTSIDKTIGKAFDLQFVDINGDGKKDILATNHESGNGGVFAYEVPANLNGTWTRHTLATGFPVRQSGIGQASPGAAHAFYPTVGSTGKPSIVVAGDATQRVHFLQPTTTDVNDWSFTMSELHDCQSTVGGIAVGDTNGDGKNELFIPCFDKGYLVTLTF